MRIAVLAHSFPRFPGDTHGPFVKSLSEALAAKGHDIDVLIPFDREIRQDPDTPLAIHSFRYIWPDSWHLLGYSRTLRRDVGLRLGAWVQSPFYFRFAERALEGLVERRQSELIHTHWLLPNGYVAARVQRRTGVPFAVTLHGSDIFMAEKNPLFRSMARRTLREARHITSCSEDLRRRLLAMGDGSKEQADKVLLVPNGTDLAPRDGVPLDALDPKLPRTADERLVVAVGRMVDKKGFRFLIDAAPRILAEHPDARLVLGGGGDLLADHQAQVRELGLDSRVSFTGHLSHGEVLALLARGEVFVMPSVRDPKGNIDGLPIVVLEAMAAGKPVVATDVAGIPLAVEDGVNGLLVPEKDPESLYQAIDGLLRDPDRMRRMGEAGRQRIEHELNWDAIAERHDTLYRRVDERSAGS